MAASINYKTFYAGQFGTGVQSALGGATAIQVSNGGSTENSSENIAQGQTNSGGNSGAGLYTVDLTGGGILANTIWSIEKFNIVLERKVQSNQPGYASTTNKIAMSYANPWLNYDKFKIVLIRGGVDSVSILFDYKIQAAQDESYYYSQVAPTTTLWPMSMSLADRAPIATVPSLAPLQSNIAQFPSLYQLNLEAGDILQFQYGYKYNVQTPYATAGSFAKYTPTYSIYMSGIEHKTA